jgi:gluconokinase
MYFGLNIKHEKQHFIRATIEGILYEIYSIGKILEEHRSIKTLALHGSFATLPFCSQLIADIFNKPVAINEQSDSIAYGAFLLSATEMGIYKSLDEAVQTVVLPDQYFPEKNHHSIYMKYFEVFERLSTKLGDEFNAIANLQ